MTRTEYQQHLVEEYASYLRRAIKGKNENYTFTPENLAVSLLKAFEKGAAKGVLYESINDVDRAERAAEKHECKHHECEQHHEEEPKTKKTQITEEQAIKMLTDLFADVFKNAR